MYTVRNKWVTFDDDSKKITIFRVHKNGEYIGFGKVRGDFMIPDLLCIDAFLKEQRIKNAN